MGQILLTFNESEGAVVTNYGTAEANAIVETEAGGEAQYTWNPNENELLGYLEILAASGPDQTIVDMEGITGLPISNQIDINLAVGFRIYSLAGGGGCYLRSQRPSHDTTGGISLRMDPVTEGEGDFNLIVQAQEDDGTPLYDITLPGLSFNVDYRLALSIDVQGTPQLKVLLDSGTVQTDTTGAGSFSGDSWREHGGKIGRASSVPGQFGFTGRLYYFYEGRGENIAWGDAALQAVNANPLTLPGWPGAGDQTAPTYSANPAVTAGPTSTTVTVGSTAADETDSAVEKAYVVLASGSPAPATGADIFNLTGNAAAAVDSGQLVGEDAVANGTPSDFVITGLDDETDYDYYEAIRDSAGNYTLAPVVNFTTTAIPDLAVVVTLRDIDSGELKNAVTYAKVLALDPDDFSLVAEADDVATDSSGVLVFQAEELTEGMLTDTLFLVGWSSDGSDRFHADGTVVDLNA